MRGYSLEELSIELLQRPKRSMKSLFALPQLRKDGTPGKITVLPELDSVQVSACIKWWSVRAIY